MSFQFLSPIDSPSTTSRWPARDYQVLMCSVRYFLFRLIVAVLMCIATSAGSDHSMHSCRDDSEIRGDRSTPNKFQAGPRAVAHSHHVTLTWNAPPGLIKGYIIERHEANDEYKRISLTIILETECADYDVAAGHAYFYQVRAVGDHGTVSTPSVPTKATVPSP